MDAEEAIRTRRSVRTYEPNSVSAEDLDALLEAGRWAPSGLNNQPWRLVIVEERARREELAACTRYSSILLNAPLHIAVFLNHDTSYDRDKDAMAIGAFVQNILIAAHSRGLGAVWLGEILNEKEKVKELLGVAPGNELMAVIAIGHISGKPGEGSRKPLEDLILGRL